MSTLTQEVWIVFRLAARMLRKLRENRWRDHWREDPPEMLFWKLRSEVEELWTAMNNGDPNWVMEEAADVANYAAMIADVTKRERGLSDERREQGS